MTAIMPVVPVSQSGASPPPPDPRELAALAVAALPSPHTRRIYARHIAGFLASGLPLAREGIHAYVGQLRKQGLSACGINHALSAIKLLAREAQAHGQLTDADVYAIGTVKGPVRRGQRTGNWLELSTLETLLDAVSHSGPQGKRNAALIACMAGCGLRRAEVANLEWHNWQQRGGRWVWLDIHGKGDRVRTVPCPAWVAEFVEDWRHEQSERNESELSKSGPHAFDEQD